jgi:DNA replication protein DnaC
MLMEQTLEKLRAMKLLGMARYLEQWQAAPPSQQLSPTELLSLLTDAEWLQRENRKLSLRLKNARLRQPACLEDVDYSHARGLTRAQMVELSSCHWVKARQNVLITGPTGMGKSYLACALGNKACREGFSVLYRRASRLYDELAQARADGSWRTVLQRFAKAHVLILDDFGLEPLNANERKDLLEVLEDRCGSSSTLITSQLEPKQWHAVIGDATVADAILDRLIHTAHRLKLAGESIRKQEGKLTSGPKAEK